MRFENDSLNNKIIEKEMLVFVSLCVHENIEKCLLIGENTPPIGADKLAKNISSMQTLNTKSEIASETFDAIISFDESADIRDVFRILKKDGIFCSKIGKNVHDDLINLGKYYRIVMPYHNMGLIFASNKYHPVADLILDKSDFIEDAEYYNSDIHIASFAIYEKLRKALKGVIKN